MTHFGKCRAPRTTRLHDPIVEDARRMARQQFLFGLGVGLVFGVVVITAIYLSTQIS